MRTILLASFIFIVSLSSGQNIGDTIVVPAFNYSQTHSPNGRDTMILFPDGSLDYEKIILSYNMRCKDGNVSTPGNTNYGCGEWDYSCNTYITDSTRVDSVLNYHPSHVISHFTGETFEYVETPTHIYFQHLQKNVEVNSIISEEQFQIGDGSLSLSSPIKANEYSGKSLYLITADELMNSGMETGDLDGLILTSLSSSVANFFRVKIKSTESNALDQYAPDLEAFTEVFFSDFDFISGENRIQFHTPFNWDGISNIIVEFSFTNNDQQNELLIEGVETGQSMGLYATNGIHIINDVGYTEIPTEPLESISNEITVSFWTYGNPEYLPANTSFISGLDENNNRNLNIHLPWSNSRIYFDCGYENGGYDRIDKAATPEEIKGNWNHWAFTKNAVSGEMKIYLNGELWHSGTEKTKPIHITKLIVGNIQNNTVYYFGKIDELRIWDTELDQNTIHDWMYAGIDNSHPMYDHLVAYYKFNEGSGNTTNDSSPFEGIAEIHDYVIWDKVRGNNLSREFVSTSQRPNFIFLQGDYDLNITTEIVTEAVENMANMVTEYEIIPRYGTMVDDSVNIVYTDFFWSAGYEYIYDPDGILIDSIVINPTGSIEITELNYYKRYPAKFELMSFVTPYGIYLDLGMDGKTWLFDITDYTPILKNWRRLTMERGGERQEDIDIKFLFIIGTPARDVINVQQIWRPGSSGYQNIMSDRTFETRNVAMPPQGDSYKIRSVITGHGQEGEFTPRQHMIKINGEEEEFPYIVWTECSTIPIYPQGGTWLYDRAGWCPGEPSDLHEFNISEYVTPGQSYLIDYTVSNGSGTSNYLVNNQLVTYAPPNFDLDAALINIINPNNENAAWERFNPACSYPMVVIQNTGNTPLSSLDISFSVEGGTPMNYTWTGSLEFLETAEIELEIPDFSFWEGSENKFNVDISNPNGANDEYPYNNTFSIGFTEVDMFDLDEWFTIECKTNGQGWQTSYSLTDLYGNVILEMNGLESNTIYTNDVNLETGCYRLRINDTGDNGLYYWHQPQYGTGYFRVKSSDGTTLENFETEFGRFAIYEFGVANLTGEKNIQLENTIVTTYPNPMHDAFHLNLIGFGNSKVNVKIFNAAMLKVYNHEFNISNSNHTEDIDVSILPNGVYLVQIEGKGKRIVKKIVKH